MKEIRISVTSTFLKINGDTWRHAPPIRDLCRVLSSGDPTDGDSIIIGGTADSKFRYFDDLGIAIIETIPQQRVKRIAIYFNAAAKTSRTFPYGDRGERATKNVFQGVLEMNGRELRSPLLSSSFPTDGDLMFINGIALGGALNAMVVAEDRRVQAVSFDFEEFQ